MCIASFLMASEDGDAVANDVQPMLDTVDVSLDTIDFLQLTVTDRNVHSELLCKLRFATQSIGD